MGRRDSPERKQRRATDLARRLVSLSTIEGVPWLEQGRLSLLGPVTAQPADPAALARTLLRTRLPRAVHFGRLIGARRHLPLDVSALAGWARDVAELRSRRDLAALVEEGVRPLRRYRGTDLDAHVDRASRTLERLGLLVQALDAAVACQQAEPDAELSPDVLVQSLPLRLYALADWTLDPLEELQALDVPADDCLRHLLRQTRDNGLANLCALLLGARRRSFHGESAPADVPADYVPAFAAGRAGCPAPCLWTLLQEPAAANLAPSLGTDNEAVLRAAERIGLIYGGPAAGTALESLARPLASLGRWQGRLRRLEELVKAHERGRSPRPRSAEEAEILRLLHGLDVPGAAVATLVEAFLFTTNPSAGVARLLSRRHLRRLAADALPRGAGAAVRALADAWLAELRNSDAVAPHVSAEAQRDRLTLTLAFPQAALALPAEVDAPILAWLREELTALPPQRVREVLPCLVSAEGMDWLRHHQSWRLSGVLRSSIPVALVQRAMRHNVVNVVTELENEAALTRYLDCLDTLGTRARKIPNLDVRSPWFARMFRGNRPWTSTVVLTLLGQARRRAAADRLAELFALAETLNAAGPLAAAGQSLARQLEEWATPVVKQSPPELEPLAVLLGEERRELEEYLHHRRLIGHGETFTDALLEPLRLTERERQEAAFIQTRLETETDARLRSHLAVRLQRLTDPVQAASRCQQVVTRARKRLERSLALLREESLQRLLDDACRAYLGDYLGHAAAADALPSGLYPALQLLAASQIDHDLLAGFLSDVLRGRPPAERPVNRDWLARAEAAGINVREWLAGVRQTVEVAGTPVTFATERDPLAVLRMGSYFDTCLSLESGCNAASTLVNALDVNKQVIYGRRGDGTVVARKLIGTNSKGELAGYRTYATQDGDDMRRCLGEILRDFAARCRLHLSDTATPEVLHPGFWYDDGNEAWLTDAQAFGSLEQPPEDVPRDPRSISAWNLRAALVAGDDARLRAVVVRGVFPAREAALFHLLRRDPAAAGALRVDWREFHADAVLQALTYAGCYAAVRALMRLLERSGEGDRALPWHCLPCEHKLLLEGVRTFSELVRGRPAGQLDLREFWLPAYLALLPVEPLANLLRLIGELTKSSEEYDWFDRWIDEAAALLQTAWLRDGETAPLVRALAEDNVLLHRLVIALANREVIPRLASGLRRLLGRDGFDEEETALALGTQGNPHDGPRLLARLRERPDSVKLAAAVIRTGHEESAEEARRLWRPPRSLDKLLSNQDWWNLAYEVGSRRLAHLLTRTFRRQALLTATTAGWNLESALLARLVFLRLPGPEGDAEALVRALIDAQPTRRIAGDLLGMLGNVARMTEIAASARPSLGDVRRRAVSGTPEERAAALDTWLDLTPTERPALVQQVLALLGADFTSLPEELRLRLARACWVSASNLPGPALETLLTCLDSLPEHCRDVLAADPGRFTHLYFALQDDAPIRLLGLESTNPQRVRTIELFLQQWAAILPGKELFDVLEDCLVWLRPQMAEPLVTCLLPFLDGSLLKDRPQLLRVAAENTGGHGPHP